MCSAMEAFVVLLLAFIWEEIVEANDNSDHLLSFHFHEHLQHLEVDFASDSVFVGATNRLYHLDRHLQLLQEARTGPLLDNVLCTEAFGENPCSGGGAARFEAILTNNINKVLVVDRSNHQLITCGSAHQGICQTRSLTNITAMKEHYSHGNTDYFIAANNPEYSTVAFVGPGPGGRDVLYVAATYTGVVSTSVRQTVPAVSSRNLLGPNAFRFAFMDGLTGGTFVRLRREAVEKYLISYVAGFSIGGYSYFVTTQPETFSMENSGSLPRVSSRFASKIVQVCQDDRTFYSYVEMPLECRADGNKYSRVSSATIVQPGSDLAKRLHLGVADHILLATFVKSLQDYEDDEDDADEEDVESSSYSALCLFRLVDVRQKFTQNIQKCFSGHQKHVGSQFSARLCVSLGMNMNSSYCGEAEENGPLVGTISLDAVPLKEFPGVQLTAIAATTTGHHTVLFLGTSQGHIKKILLEGDGSSWEYEEIILQDGVKISSDLRFNSNRTHLYAMTKNKVFKLALSNCKQYATCEDCRLVKDPFCGWCSLEKKCSARSACLHSSDDNRWLSHRSWECIRIPSQFVNPVQIGVKRSTQVAIGIKALPVLRDGDEYLCVFGSNLSVSVGLTAPNEIKCQTPKLDRLSSSSSSSGVQALADHANVTLFIRSTQTGISFLETVLTFYDCDRHQSCTSCSQSSWDCYWCSLRNACLQVDDIPTCPDIVISEHHLCPRLQYVASGQILIPSSVPHQISLAALFLPHTSKAADAGYECLIHLTSPPIRIPAKRLSASALVCSTYQYSYEAAEPTKTISLEVTWNGGHYIDDNYGITVTVYRCDIMASDCSSCLSLQEMSDTIRYGCQWCVDRCQSNSTCGHLQTTSMCPLPDIQEVYPLSGALEGGTLLTIKGINLGRNYEQVRHAVKVAGVPCETVASEYVISKLIVCKTGHVTAFHRGSIVVTVGDATVSWETEFTYQNPQVTKMFPVVGPKAGGTKVTFEGHHLDTGAVIRVFMDFKPCHIDFVNSTHLVCTTAPMNGASFCPVTVRFDGSIRQLQTEFEFMENPSIFDIRPLSTFTSGGRLITVSGANFDSVQHPVMHLHKKSNTYSSKCNRKSNSILLCPSPFLTRGPSPEWKRRRSLSTDCTISFTMDNVESVRYVAVHFPDVKSTLTVHSDPVYNSFEDGLKLYKGEALILTGLNLNLACDAEEVKVWIGNETCRVNSIDLTTLYCTPPVVQPPYLGADGLLDPNSLPLVKVVVGNLFYTLGQLEYQKAAADDSEYWIIGVAFGGGTLLTIIFVILIVYKRKSTHAERQFKKLNLQLDTLEINIRNECKQAFAELQTEVSDFTSDLNLIGIPFWDYTNFTYKVLFPTDSACSAVLSDVRDQKEFKFYDVWSKFNDLFYNQHFVIVFVRTLEEQKNFTIRDKAKVASLLMIVFHDRLDYATQILKVLLGDLIDRSVERKHPKLMLRRTESVVEKMLTNWLSMCLYGYIKTRAGKALFMLYKAIKHQTEKGPIDAITSDARYSLSEDRLLREKTESKALTVYLIPSQENVEPICCRMLDCDIITQAKEKALDAIYMNTPFSRRPYVEQVDLQWLSSPCGRVILRDEDASTQIVRGWKKLNTLAHCQVPDGATMSLVAIQSKTDSNCLSNDLSKVSVNASNTILASEENSRHFHLVSPEEGQHVGRSQKVISEIFLTRLLATKCTLQQYVDDLFSTILTPDTSSLSAVKYLFDFLDAAAQRHCITDTEVLHTWKCNSLLLRFWVNIIKNPEFVFDIHKSPIVDSCLSIIAQTFMDSCSTQDQRLGKDSPSTKLLYAKDIPRYRHLVTQFYKGMNEMPTVDDNHMSQIMKEHSKANAAYFNVEFALQQLFQYTKQYNLELLEALEDEPSARKEQVSKAYEQVTASIDGFNCI